MFLRTVFSTNFSSGGRGKSTAAFRVQDLCMEVRVQLFLCGRPRHHEIVAAVTSGLLTIVKTGITIVSYFGDVTASLFALTIVRKFTPR